MALSGSLRAVVKSPNTDGQHLDPSSQGDHGPDVLSENGPGSRGPLDHGHSHGHGHSHEIGGDWAAWVREPTLRVVLGLVALAAVANLIGVAALWPRGDGQADAIANADEIGLVTERLEATVQEVHDRPCSYSTEDDPQDCREVTFLLGQGPEAGAIIILPEFNLTFDQTTPSVSVGDKVILGFEDTTNFYFYADRDRRGSLLLVTILFVVVVVALGRFRGALALVGMATTVLVLIAFVAPSVLDGHDPLLVSVVAASVIAFVSLYLTHGFSPTTTVALAGTLGALGLTLTLSWVSFQTANFTGLATEEALTLPLIAGDIDLASLLLGGAMLGALGALDDVTVTQVATVAELRHRNPNLSTAELVASGIRVGREHIASTVNTLLLAYVGASMPLLLFFAISDQSLAMVANSEIIAVEIIRTLCGSIGLVAAVPITTALAAAVVGGAAAPSITASESDIGPPRPISDGADKDRDAPPAWAQLDPAAGPPATARPLDPDAATSTAPQTSVNWDDFGPEGDEPHW